jgi:hypothetical protein
MANPGIIEDTEWNAAQTTIAQVLGTPSGSTLDLGYNIPGSITSGQVANNAVIDDSHWNTLRTDVNTAIRNQTGADTALVTKGTSDIIFSSDFTLVAGFIATANTNRMSVNTGQLTFQNGVDATFNGSWATQAAVTGRINFGSNARFRGFWNGGGRLVFSASRSGGSPTNHNTSWTNLLASMGSVVLTANSMTQTGQTATGSYSNSGNLGVYGTSIGGAFTEVFILEDSGNTTPSYRPNDISILLRYDNADRFSTTFIDYTIALRDEHVAIGAGPDFVDGTLTLNCDIFYPFTNSATAVTQLAANQS